MSRTIYAASQPTSRNALVAGESTIAREVMGATSVTLASGTMRFVYFTAAKTETVGNLRTCTSTTAAGATPTLCRVGVYEVAANGNLTLLGAIANDTTLWTTTNTAYTRAITAPFTKTAGVRYAVGVLIVTAAATPNMPMANVTPATEATFDPRVAASLASQTDLPSSVASGSLSTGGAMIYAVLTP